MRDDRRISWKLHAERALLLGWGRAVLLQFAHPLVAAGVAEHTQFATARYGLQQRLRRTLDAMLVLTFGTPDEAVQVARRINAIHDSIHGQLPEAAGIFPGRTLYSAHDPALLRWVHATLLDSFLVTYERFIGPLSDQERDRYCAESRMMEQLLGLPEGYLPDSRADLAGYVDHMMQSGVIHVTETARILARRILWPEVTVPLRPLSALIRLSTVGLLPPAVRTAYGLQWTAGHETALVWVAGATRHALPVLPPSLRYWSRARRAWAGVEEDGSLAGATEARTGSGF
ncbi:MAG: DUF2236 domain-containing protein [Ardenticatenaceae bacterium]|nr:DUF2236 domain-containing protein [Ardenticatenaceae bacterium]